MIEDMKFLEEQAELLKVIAHPVRLCIVRGLWRRGSCNAIAWGNLRKFAAIAMSHRLSEMHRGRRFLAGSIWICTP